MNLEITRRELVTKIKMSSAEDVVSFLEKAGFVFETEVYTVTLSLEVEASSPSMAVEAFRKIVDDEWIYEVSDEFGNNTTVYWGEEGR